MKESEQSCEVKRACLQYLPITNQPDRKNSGSTWKHEELLFIYFSQGNDGGDG
jgi:hypothetical protein